MSGNPDHTDKDEGGNGETDLRTRLIEAQFDFHESKSHALVVVISGYLSADVEDAINRLTAWMDPRNIRVHAQDWRAGGHDEDLAGRPPEWWFWQRLPARGRIAFFYDGWYHDALNPLADPRSPVRNRQVITRLCRFEAMLEMEGVRLLKVWLDRKPRAVENRFDELENDTDTKWKITRRDRAVRRAGPRYRNLIRRVLNQTAGTDGYLQWQTLTLDQNGGMERLGDTILEALSPDMHQTPPPAAGRAPKQGSNTLSTTPPARPMAKDDYREQLQHWQGEIRRLTLSRAFLNRSLVVAFEGFDAAGKGGTVRRLTRAIDPRQWDVIPIAAPTDEERLHPYLWRFWRHVPARGDVTIFDRSWYGRVLVERVEKLTAPADWQRAFGEIRDFEASLTDGGVMVLKFWLSLSAKEQRRRFKSREKRPHKRYKLTDEDWRNYAKRPAYEIAVADMLAETSTPDAPWHVIDAEHKRPARVEVLKIIANHLEHHIKT